MNNIIIVISFILIVCLFSHCDCDDCDSGTYETNATIYLINETSENILSEDECNRDIAAKDTLIYYEKIKMEYSKRPDINNYFPFSEGFCLLYYDKANEICEKGLYDIKNYEERREIEPLVFEFTFRFTEERKAEADPC